MKPFSGWIAFVLLLGAVIGFGAGRSGHDAYAQSVDNKTTRWIGGTMQFTQGQDCLMLFDAQTNRLLAYTIDGSKKLHLMAVREISYDLKLASYGEQRPSAQEIRKIWEDEEKKKEDRKSDDNK